MPKGTVTLLRSLEANGVEYVFGVCGDTSVGLYRAFAQQDHDIEHVLARDERSASFMADAYARLSGKPGVCEGPSGGGATYLIPGLAEANDSSVPVIGINTNIPVRYRGRGVLTELPQSELFDPVTKWNASVDHPDLIPRMLRQAFREAVTGRPGATHLSMPIDVLDASTDEPVYPAVESGSYPAYRPTPDEDRIQQALEILETSDRPVIVAGGGVHASGAWDPLRRLADHAGIPVAQTLTSVGCIGDSPYSIGVVGENGSRDYANEMVTEADSLFLLGTAVESVWTEKWSQPADTEMEIVHADIDAASIGRNYRTAVAVPGDVRRTLSRLLVHIDRTSKWDKAEIQERHEDWVAPYDDAADSDEFPLRPERIVADTQAVLDDDAVIVSDPGTSCPYFAALYEFTEPGRHWITPRAHGALGYAIPGVVGAHVARPGATVVGFTGDGSFGVSVGDLETLARLDANVTLVVINNEAFSWIEAGQRNYADFSFGVDFEDTNFAGIAREFGLCGHRVDAADEFKSTLRAAVSETGPSLIDVPTRPLPSLPNTPVDWLEPED